MRILIVCGEYFNSSNGLSLSTQRFVEQFKRLGDEVRVLSSNHGGISEYSVPIMRFYAQEVLLQEIRRADLYVHCANVEIEGMGCMEAFAQGTVPLIADSELSSTAAYAITEKNRYQAGNAEELAGKIDFWFEHQDELPALGQRYIDLAKTLTIEQSTAKVRTMMQEAIREKQLAIHSQKGNE